jgi:hypothetical protein
VCYEQISAGFRRWRQGLEGEWGLENVYEFCMIIRVDQGMSKFQFFLTHYFQSNFYLSTAHGLPLPSIQFLLGTFLTGMGLYEIVFHHDGNNIIPYL